MSAIAEGLLVKALAQRFDDRRVLRSSDSVRVFDDRIEQCRNPTAFQTRGAIRRDSVQP